MRQSVVVIGWVLCWSVAAAEPEAPVVEAPEAAPKSERLPHRGVFEDVVEVERSEVTQKDRIAPAYPKDALKQSVEGECQLHLIIGTTGRTEHVQVLACDPMFVEVSVNAAMATRFAPVLVNGEPVKAAFDHKYKFRLSGAAYAPPPPPVLDPPLIFEAPPAPPDGKFRQFELSDLSCEPLTPVSAPEEARGAGGPSSCEMMLYIDAQGEVVHAAPLVCEEPFISAVQATKRPLVCEPVKRRGEAIAVKTAYTFQL